MLAGPCAAEPAPRRDGKRRWVRRALLSSLLLALAASVASPSAFAGTVYIGSGGAMQVEVSPGQQNAIRIYLSCVLLPDKSGCDLSRPQYYHVYDANGYAMVPGANCSWRPLVSGGLRAGCDSLFVSEIVVDLKDGDDSVRPTVSAVDPFALDRPLTVYGQSGDDTITGTRLSDYLYGGGDNDTITGGEGVDRIDGGGGDDRLDGEEQADELVGGTGDDTLYGESGSFSIPFNDSGADVLDGGADADYLEGGPRNDDLYGGSGTLEGTSDYDTVDYSRKPGGVQVTVGNGAADDGLKSDPGDNVQGDVEAVVGSAYDDILVGDSRDNWLYGGEGKDTLRGGLTQYNDGADYLDGGDGDEDLVTYEGREDQIWVKINDQADDGAGCAINLPTTCERDDIRSTVEDIIGGNDSDNIRADESRPTENILIGGPGNDYINGYGGDDYLAGGADDDTLVGRGGDDVFYEGKSANGKDTFYGGDGYEDEIYYGDRTRAVTVWLSATGPGFEGSGEAGQEGDTIDDLVENAVGGSGRDHLNGNSRANKLEGRGGADTFWGLGGPDTFDGGAGSDTVDYTSESAGVDVTIGDGRSDDGPPGEGDTVRGNVENIEGSDYGDTITGDPNDDDANTFNGYRGDDTLRGKGGPDTLDGGDDRDDFYGGGGGDTIRARDGEADTIRCGKGNERDKVSYDEGIDIFPVDHGCEGIASSYSGVVKINSKGKLRYVAAADVGNNLTITETGPSAFVIGEQGASVEGGNGCNANPDGSVTCTGSVSGIDVDVGNWGDTVRIESSTGATVRGGRGADTLTGGSGRDRLKGGPGGDYLYGEAGVDRLRGGDGADHLFGGPGTDYSHGGEGRDEIEDRSPDVDHLFGEEGNDNLTAADYNCTATRCKATADTVECGAGDDDYALGDYADKLKGCERKQRVIISPQTWPPDPDVPPTDVSVVGTRLEVTASPGVENEIVVKRSESGDLEITDYATTVESGVAGCAQSGVGHSVTCSPASAGFDRVLVDAGDGDDAVATSWWQPVSVYGGPGRDVLTTQEDASWVGTLKLYGGPGDDILAQLSERCCPRSSLYGEGGNDLIDGGLGADYMRGGPGTDTVTYARRRATFFGGEFSISLDNVANDGERLNALSQPEGDDVGGDFEVVIGSQDRDTIVADWWVTTNILIGGAGADEIDGGRGSDILDGGEGDDTLTGGPDEDEFHGGGGNDKIYSRDAVAEDPVDCGDYPDADDDFAEVDDSDAVRDNCERVDVRDITPPEVTVTSGPTGVTEDPTPTFTFDSDEPGSTFECKLDSGSWVPCSSPYTTPTLADGWHTFRVQATDRAGNSGFASRTFRVIYLPTSTIVFASSGTLRYLAIDGQANQVTITQDPGSPGLYEITDPGATIEAGPGCVANPQPSIPADVLCDGSTINGGDNEGVDRIKVEAGDLDDTVQVVGGTPATILGGAGGDELTGGDGDDTLDGGAGADTLRGGGGSDTADYSQSQSRVRVTLDGRANDGQRGERDNVETDMENVIGGPGDDRLFGQKGSAVANRLEGGRGRDRLKGYDGADVLIGGEGRDSLSGGDGGDELRDSGPAGERNTLRGGDDDDALYGGDGDDRLVGGRGVDVIDARGPGVDRVSGGSEDDWLFVNDGYADRVNCGSGSVDRIWADPEPMDRLSPNCEVVVVLGGSAPATSGNGSRQDAQPAPSPAPKTLGQGEAPAAQGTSFSIRTTATRATRSGTVRLRLRCSSGTPCVGVLRLKATRPPAAGPRAARRRRLMTLARRRFRVPAGKTRTIRVKLARRGRRALRRAKRLRVQVSARLGSETTRRTIRVSRARKAVS